MRRNAFWTSLPPYRIDRRRAPLVWGGVIVFGALGLAACGQAPGAFDVEDAPQTKMANLEALVQFRNAPRQPSPTDQVVCPDISILDGTADDRAYGSGTDESNANLRYQYSINDIARDCSVQSGQMSLKVGVAGKVLLGPVGAPGNFTAPIRIAIIRRANEEPVVSKLYQIPTTVPGGSTDAPFTLVADDLVIPYSYANAQHDFEIKVGFDIGAPADKTTKKDKWKRKRMSPDAASAGAPNGSVDPASTGSPRPHHHHHQSSSAD
ncbi:MAG: hypothetical protein ABSC72_04305 [Methylovirgula sp.]|jgi:hypothetical protein